MHLFAFVFFIFLFLFGIFISPLPPGGSARRYPLQFSFQLAVAVGLQHNSLARLLFRATLCQGSTPHGHVLFAVLSCQPVRQPAAAIRFRRRSISTFPRHRIFFAIPATFQIIHLLAEDFNLAFHDCDLVHPFTALLFVLPYGSYPSPCSVLDRLCLQAGQR